MMGLDLHNRELLPNLSDPGSAHLKLKCDLAWLRLVLAFDRFVRLSAKANFNPGQLRVPAGAPGGGQWTDGGGSDLIKIGARGRTSVHVRVRGRTLEATPAQTTRLAIADARASDATARVREIDPTWRPVPSISNTVEGEIATREGEARQAEARLRELTRGGVGGNGGPPLEPATPRAGTGTASPSQCIASYRTITGMPDLGDRPAIGKSEGTVAFAEIDGRLVIGVNSNAPGYTAADEFAAETLRNRLVERYPELMATDNLGHRPNDALFHAEANALLRAEDGGQYLHGRTIEMRVDRRLCRSCEEVLPLVGTYVGNPTVRIIDGTGALWIMRDGIWVRRGRP